MFGFSLNKLVFTVLAVVAVWYAFKWVGRLQSKREEDARLRRSSAKVGKGGGSPAPGSAGSAQGAGRDGEQPVMDDMVACAKCGDYVSATAAVNCGREGCPYPG